jgi:hypothetical protein
MSTTIEEEKKGSMSRTKAVLMGVGSADGLGGGIEPLLRGQ